MVQKMHLMHSKTLIPASVSLLVFVFTLAGCGSSQPPVIYDNYATLENDCAALLSNYQTASISGALNIHETTLCISDQEGGRCKILLGNEEIGLDIWMETGGKNGMEYLPDPYLSSDLVVKTDDGEKLTYNDRVTVTLKPFNDKEAKDQACSFRVQTVLRSKISAAENQPGEGIVNLDIPANVIWFDTQVYVNQGQTIALVPGFESYNLQDNDPNWEAMSYSMDGVSDTICEANCLINGQNYGALVAKIGQGEPFPASSMTYGLIVPANGELYLAVNDCVECFADNSGNFDLVLYLQNEP